LYVVLTGDEGFKAKGRKPAVMTTLGNVLGGGKKIIKQINKQIKQIN